MEDWIFEIERTKEHQSRWVEKLKSKYENDIDYVIERLMDKYYSDEYIDREYKLGFQPREPLLWLLLAYAEKYCNLCNDERYLNQFTGTAYYLGSYVIQTMYGQGAIIKVDKIVSEK